MSDLTREQIAERLSYDAETGLFRWRIPVAACRVGQVAGCASWTGRDRGRVLIGIDGRLYKAHRLAWTVMAGSPPPALIDHIDGNPSNNAWRNLRAATVALNGQNRKTVRKDSQVGLLGVTKHKKTGTYRSAIQVDGRRRSLGYFATPEMAHRAYIEAKRQLHPFNTL